MLEVIYLISRARPSGPINQALNILKGLKQKKDVHAVLVTLAPEMKERSWMQRFHDAGIDVVQFNQPLWKTWKCISMLDNYVKEHNIQIIHSAGYRADFVSTMAKCSAKKVSTQRCRPDEIAEKFPKLLRPLFEEMHLKMIKKMNAIIACSCSLQQIFRDEYGMDILAVPNGVNTDNFVPASLTEKKNLQRKLNLDGYQRIFIVLGSLRTRKNVKLIINAFRAIKNKNYGLLIVGRGPEEDELRLLSKGYENIIFTGNVPNPLDFLKMSDIIISSSLAEGLPNTILEAMSCGLPSILSDIGPHKELVTDSRLGILFKCDSEVDLVAALQKSLTWNTEEMKPFIRQHAIEKHSVNSLANNYTEIYKKVVV